MTDRNSLGLTVAQTRVLASIARGNSTIKMISRDTHLAGGTVRIHVRGILRALGVRDRVAAIAELAKRAGLDLSTWIKEQT